MEYLLIASTFWPKNFWWIVFAYLAGSALVVALSFRLASRFAGSSAWVFGGMLLGMLAAVNWYGALIFAGAAAGALVGAAASILVVTLNR